TYNFKYAACLNSFLAENSTSTASPLSSYAGSSYQFGLMASFMRHPNQILSKRTLFEHVWGEDFYGADNTLMVHIRRLRGKIEDNPSDPSYIVTVKGLGYRFMSNGD